MNQGIYVIFATNDCSKQLHVVKKNTLQIKTEMVKGYAFKDSVLDLVQKITIACIFDSFTVKDLPE